MPRLVYSPKGAEPQTWDFTFGDLLMPEVVAIEKASGINYYEDAELLFFHGNAELLFGMLLVFLKRDQPTLTMKNLAHVRAGDIGADFADSELVAVRDGMAKNLGSNMTDEQAAALAALDERIAGLPDEEDPGDDDPKD